MGTGEDRLKNFKVMKSWTLRAFALDVLVIVVTAWIGVLILIIVEGR